MLAYQVYMHLLKDDVLEACNNAWEEYKESIPDGESSMERFKFRNSYTERLYLAESDEVKNVINKFRNGDITEDEAARLLGRQESPEEEDPNEKAEWEKQEREDAERKIKRHVPYFPQKIFTDRFVVLWIIFNGRSQWHWRA